MRHITKTMKDYSKTSEWGKHKMSVEQLIKMSNKETAKEVTIANIQDVIRSFKSRKVNDSNILDFLIDTFGTQFTKDDLEEFIAKTK